MVYPNASVLRDSTSPALILNLGGLTMLDPPDARAVLITSRSLGPEVPALLKLK